MDCSPTGSSVHVYSPDKNTGVVCRALLQGIFHTQELNLGLPHCKWILYCLSHQGSPWILDWVAYPFSRGSSWPRNWTRVSCIAGRFFTSWATREAQPESLVEASSWDSSIFHFHINFRKPRFFKTLKNWIVFWLSINQGLSTLSIWVLIRFGCLGYI